MALYQTTSFCIFAPMNSLKRRISALFLLSVVLPVVFLAPFHHHDEPLPADISCEECAHHQSHPGHLSEGHGTDECLVCQFLAQQFTPSAGPAVLFLSSGIIAFVCDRSDDVLLPLNHHSSPRAPPVSFCF